MVRFGTLRSSEPPAAQVPLRRVEFAGRMLGFCSEVAVSHTFSNDSATTCAEVVFEFLLPLSATVCSFRAEVDGRVVEGAVREKERARAAYDDGVAAGHGAYLLERDKETPELLTVSLGNLAPGAQAKVVLTYAEVSQVEGEDVVFCLPDSVASSSAGASADDVEVGLRVALEMPCQIRSVTSRTHPVTFEIGDKPGTGTVTLAPGVSLLSGSAGGFRMGVSLVAPREPSARALPGVVAASFFPRLAADGDDVDVFSEIIFVVDRSGSMSGTKMQRVKETLKIFLKSLPEGTLFNIVCFGTNHSKLFGESAEYNDSTLGQATMHVEKMSADMGGTDVLSPLTAIYGEKTKPGYPRQIFLLTDGQVDNTTECVKTVRSHADSTRMFTFAIGNDADVNLVREMAKAGEGECEMVTDTSAMRETVMRQLQRALQPAITDLKVDWGGLHVQQTPFELPPLFNGNKVVVFGLIDCAETDAVVTLGGKVGQRAFTSSVKVEWRAGAFDAAGHFVKKLAAKSLLKDIEEGRSYLGKCPEDVRRKESLRISLANGILSSQTAFVAIERRDGETATGEAMVKREIKLQRVCRPPAECAESSLLSAIRGGHSYKLYSAANSSPSDPLIASLSQALCKRRCMMPPDDGDESEDDDSWSDSADGGVVSSSATLESQDKILDDLSKSVAEIHSMAQCMSAELGDQGQVCDHIDSSQEVAAAASAPPRKGWFSSIFGKKSKPAVATSVFTSDGAVAPPSPPPPPPPPQAPSQLSSRASGTNGGDAVDLVTSEQRANGSWSADTVEMLCGVSRQVLAQEMPSELSGKGGSLDLWATLIVVAFLTARHAARKVEWELMVRKANKWCRNMLASVAPGLASLDAAVHSFLVAHNLS